MINNKQVREKSANAPSFSAQGPQPTGLLTNVPREPCLSADGLASFSTGYVNILMHLNLHFWGEGAVYKSTHVTHIGLDFLLAETPDFQLCPPTDAGAAAHAGNVLIHGDTVLSLCRPDVSASDLCRMWFPSLFFFLKFHFRPAKVHGR